MRAYKEGIERRGTVLGEGDEGGILPLGNPVFPLLCIPVYGLLRLRLHLHLWAREKWSNGHYKSRTAHPPLVSHLLPCSPQQLFRGGQTSGITLA
ncbi:hypothetical protein E2C01_066742 [Portunus trituberculatus]|uniref:Uncharacterized protein n=1 Tax=Portunus trituberculatus TaxID=210409 RepID=A0A5B7HT60_PORTR|nr:hypothetical protein [Portunus trituberculatus]